MVSLRGQEGYKPVGAANKAAAQQNDKKPTWLKMGGEPGTKEFEAPSWLNDEDVEASDGDANKSSELSSTKKTSLNTSKELEPTEDSQAGDATDDTDAQPKRRRRFGKTTCLVSISTILFALFVYSSSVQDNDVDRFQWTIYYALSAVTPVLFLVHWFCSYKLLEKSIYLLSATVIVWSIVYMILISSDLKKLSGEELSGPDGELREECIFELAGVSIALCSALYHSVGTWCLVSRRKKENDLGEDEE